MKDESPAQPAVSPPFGSRYLYVAPSRDGAYATVQAKGKIDPFFYRPYDYALHSKVQEALSSHVSRYPEIPLAFLEFFPDGTRLLYGYRPDETHYSASMVKVAAVYAAFALRSKLRQFAAARPGSDVLARAARHFNPGIIKAARELKTRDGTTPLLNAPPEVLLPQYKLAFVASRDNRVVNFTPGFEQNYLHKNHDNGPAGHLIHRIGYGYINGQLARAALAKLRDGEGMWLAGDYWPPSKKGKYPAFRVPCSNERSTAQGAGVQATALLFGMMMEGKATVPQATGGGLRARDELSKEFTAALAWKNRSWLPRVSGKWNAASFSPISAKPGLGEIRGNLARSDVSRFTYHPKGGRPRDFVIAFQNVVKPKDEINAYGKAFADSLHDVLRPYLDS